jgi:predicted nucleic acid-binding protein
VSPLLLDTNVLSELLRERPAKAVLGWFATQPAATLHVSAVTQAEMLLGARLLPTGKRRAQLEQALDGLFGEDFAGRVLPFDAAAVPYYASIVAERQRAGRPISQFHAQIAAIARSRRLQLATRNVDDFDGCGIDRRLCTSQNRKSAELTASEIAGG